MNVADRARGEPPTQEDEIRSSEQESPDHNIYRDEPIQFLDTTSVWPPAFGITRNSSWCRPDSGVRSTRQQNHWCPGAHLGPLFALPSQAGGRYTAVTAGHLAHAGFSHRGSETLSSSVLILIPLSRYSASCVDFSVAAGRFQPLKGVRRLQFERATSLARNVQVIDNARGGCSRCNAEKRYMRSASTATSLRCATRSRTEFRFAHAPKVRPGVCIPWEEEFKRLPEISGDRELVRRVWEDIDTFGYLYIWHVLVG